jgi:hypothetical protein
MFSKDAFPRLYPRDARIEEINEILQTSVFNTVLNRKSQDWSGKLFFISYVYSIVDTIALQMQDVRFAI